MKKLLALFLLLSLASARAQFIVDNVISSNMLVHGLITLDTSANALQITNVLGFAEVDFCTASPVPGVSVCSSLIFSRTNYGFTTFDFLSSLRSGGRIWCDSGFYGDGSQLTNVASASNSILASFVAQSPLSNTIPIANVTTPGQIITNGNSTAVIISNALATTGNLTNGADIYIPEGNKIYNKTHTATTVTMGSELALNSNSGNIKCGGNLYYNTDSADLGLAANYWRNAYLRTIYGSNILVNGNITATNGVIQMVKPSFSTNFTCTTNLQFYLCNGTNQVVTLPNAANVPKVIYRFSCTNGYSKLIITNATGAQTIRDGTSLSYTNIGIAEVGFLSDGANWWLASRGKLVFPNAQFSTTTNIPLAVANTAYPVTFNSVDFDNSQGIVLGAGTNGLNSKMWITNSGSYEFSPSVVISFGGNNTVRYWFRSNGTNIANSCTPVRGQNNTIRVVTVVFVVTVTEPTAFEIWAESDSTSESLLAQAASGNYPAAPAVICPVKRISDIWP